MKKGILNKVFMLKRLNTIFDTNREKWETNPKSVAVIEELSNLITRFDEFFVQQAGLKEPYGEVKQEYIDDFFPKFQVLLGYAYSVAMEQKNTELTKLFNRSESALRKGTIINVYSRIQNIYGQMASIEASIAEFEGGAELYAEVGTLMTALSAYLNLPRERNKELRYITSQIEALDQAVSIFLKSKLDPVANYFKNKDEEFYRLYKLNRRVPKYDLKVGVPANATDPVYPEASGDSPGGEDYS